MNRISTALAAIALAASTGALAAPAAFAQLPAENGEHSNVVPQDPQVNEYSYPNYAPQYDSVTPARPTPGDAQAGLYSAATGVAAIGVALTAVWLTGRRRHGARPTR